MHTFACKHVCRHSSQSHTRKLKNVDAQRCLPTNRHKYKFVHTHTHTHTIQQDPTLVRDFELIIILVSWTIRVTLCCYIRADLHLCVCGCYHLQGHAHNTAFCRLLHPRVYQEYLCKENMPITRDDVFVPCTNNVVHL